jgi:hypothetical protein
VSLRCLSILECKENIVRTDTGATEQLINEDEEEGRGLHRRLPMGGPKCASPYTTPQRIGAQQSVLLNNVLNAWLTGGYCNGTIIFTSPGETYTLTKAYSLYSWLVLDASDLPSKVTLRSASNANHFLLRSISAGRTNANLTATNINFHRGAQRGNGPSGGSIIVQTGAVATFRNCSFIDNMAGGTGLTGNGNGGAVSFQTNSRGKFEDCVFRNNTAWGTQGAYGGAVYITSPAVDIIFTRCIFTDNRAIVRGLAQPKTAAGGAVYFTTASTSIRKVCGVATGPL